MSSSARSEGFDLDRDLPTTPEDVAALRRARSLPLMNLAEYLRFLAQFPPATNEELRRKRGPMGPPFELTRWDA